MSWHWAVCPVHDDAHTAAAASDTVVIFVGSNPPEGGPPLRSVTAGGAVLIAITTPDAGPVAELADAVVTLPSSATTAAGAPRRTAFDLLASLAVEAIGRELSGPLPQDPSNKAGYLPTRTTLCCQRLLAPQR